MRRGLLENRTVRAVGVLALLVAFASPAWALDAYQDRRGFFGGFGLGGGAVFDGSEPGGGAILDFQIGGGATRNLTLAMDVDFWMHALDQNTKFLIDPGPELTYFFGETGVFVRAGIGVALCFIWPDSGDYAFKAGFDGTLGVGWEFFITSSLAMGLSLEGDYIVLSGDDLASVSALFTLKRY